LGDAAEDRAQVEAGIMRLGAGQQAVENIDRGAGLHLAGDAAFVQRGDEEGLAALVGERLGDRADAEAVGVGLDDAGALGAARGLVQTRPVGAQGGEVDGQDGAGRQRDRAARAGGGRPMLICYLHSLRSGRYWSWARSEKRVTAPSNCMPTVPIG